MTPAVLVGADQNCLPSVSSSWSVCHITPCRHRLPAPDAIKGVANSRGEFKEPDMTADRKDRELIRKRRNNLLRRHNEFAQRYDMRIWLTMEMPSGRFYTYRSHPQLVAPTDGEIVSSRDWPSWCNQTD